MITYVVTDSATSAAGEATGTVTVTVAANIAPTTNVAMATGAEDATGIQVMLSGADTDGTVASFEIKSLPANGVLKNGATTLKIGDTVLATSNGATVTFVPALNFNGTASFTFAAKDNLNLEDATPETATVTVTAVNDALVYISESLTASFDENMNVGKFSFRADDPDIGQTLRVANGIPGFVALDVKKLDELNNSNSQFDFTYLAQTNRNLLALDLSDGIAFTGGVVGYGNPPAGGPNANISPFFQLPHVFFGSPVNNMLTGNNMNDFIFGSGGHDVLSGVSGNDLLDGGSGNDMLNGGSGIDSLIGGDGDDSLTGGENGDFLSGGAGANRFLISAGDSGYVNASTPGAEADTIIDFLQSSTNVLDFGGVQGTSTNYSETMATLANFAAAAAEANSAFSTSLYHFAADGTNGYLFFNRNGDSVLGAGDDVVVIQGVNANNFSAANIFGTPT